MKKYQSFLVLTLTTLYFVWSYYDYESVRKENKAFLVDTNMTVVDIKNMLFNENESLSDVNFTFWDMKKSKLLTSREKKELLSLKNKKKDTIKEENIKLKDRTICLENKCWEFLGIVTIDNRISVTLLSKGKKVKLKTFYVNDMLLENIKIISIKGDTMFLKDLKKDKRFILKLFNIDIAQYIPKKKIKEKNE